DFTPNIVRRIFNSYLSGKGFDRIARELLEEGIPTPSQIAKKANATSLWHGSSVRAILENPHYTGDLVQQRETTINVTTDKRKKNDPSEFIIVKDTHEAIISKEDFKIVQQLIKERKRKRPRAKKHLFTNIAFCSSCGNSMHYKKSRKGYICGKFNKHGRTQCTAHHVNEDALIGIITQDIKKIFSSFKSDKFRTEIGSRVTKLLEKDQKRLLVIDKEIDRLKQDKINALRAKVRKEIENDEYQLLDDDCNSKISKQNKEKKIIQKNINKRIKQNKINALRDKVRKEIENDEYQLLVDDCNSKISKLNEEKILLQETLNKKQNELDFNELHKKLEEFMDNPTLDRKILHKLIERIEILEDGSPRIYYRFSNSYMSSIFLRATNSTPRASFVGTYRRVGFLLS